jgi:anti-sigma-K factor RskA
MEFITPEDRYQFHERKHNEILAKMVVAWMREMKKLEALTPPPKDLIDWWVRWEKRLEAHANETKLVLPAGYSARS